MIPIHLIHTPSIIPSRPSTSCYPTSYCVSCLFDTPLCIIYDFHHVNSQRQQTNRLRSEGERRQPKAPILRYDFIFEYSAITNIFQGIFTAFSEGKVPSNEQIDVALNSFLRSRALGTPSKNLSREGQELVQDVKQVINEAKKLLLSKNQGNLIQEFVWDAQGISGGNARTPNAPVDKATARQHGDEALDGLKTLGRLILSNGQFRKLLDDALVLARDVAGDAAQEAANKVNPSEDRLKSIDEPAEDNTWHDVPHASDLKQKASDTYQSNKPFSREDAKQAAREGADTAQQHPTNDQQAGRAGANNAAQNLRQKAEANVPEETKENVRNASSAVQQKSKNYLSKKMPQERREQTVYRLKKMIVEIQGHSDCE